ncbi:salicylate hydroxylase [Ophiocordyceps sinensis CO18]|uniref:Salicylate hydroxylase n=1 Tax=Ophiocordyceps sinensis (strain Co18 / CGMCC 3.14243) TaxID=911162 RepID=T5AJC1_OPHSC|nr:salicylate hydroxylase [Ophiocordyceps sinensis CO18]
MGSIDPPNRQFTVTIIGAGVGGLTLALGLIRNKVPVDIYEAAPDFKSTGFGISMGPAAHRALTLIDPSISKAYDALVTTHADSPGYESFRRTWFELVWTTADKCGEVMTNLKAKTLGQTLRFEDGSSTVADVVVGCDGIHSRVRQHMLLGEPIRPQYSGMYAYRAVLDMATMIEAVGERRARVATMYMGHGGYVVTYPIMRAKQVNVGLFKLSSGWEHDTWVRLASRDEMKRDFGHMGDAVRSIVQRIETPSQWAVLDIPHMSTYTRNSITVLGDAAHASTPHQGAGAGQAIEDVHVLAELLGDARVLRREHVKAAFHAYDAIRRPRSQWVVSTSRDMGHMLSLSLGTVCPGEVELKHRLNERMALLWDLDILGQADIARRVMLQHFSWIV